MTTDAELLDSIKRARSSLAHAEDRQHEVEALLRDAKKAVGVARKKYDLSIEEALAEHRQPSLFDQGAAVTVEPVTVSIAVESGLDMADVEKRLAAHPEWFERAGSASGGDKWRLTAAGRELARESEAA